MAKALILYHSKTGTTKKLSYSIRDFIKTMDIESRAIPIENYVAGDLNGIDIIILGCWTSGLFIVMQHPEKEWIDFANTLPDLSSKKIVLFTTYKLLTGSMFVSMKKHLKIQSGQIGLTFKSRNSALSESNQLKLKEFIISN